MSTFRFQCSSYECVVCFACTVLFSCPSVVLRERWAHSDTKSRRKDWISYMRASHVHYLWMPNEARFLSHESVVMSFSCCCSALLHIQLPTRCLVLDISLAVAVLD